MKELPSHCFGGCVDLKGNSNSDERMRFIEQLLKIFPDAQIRCLCADREFIGQAGIRYLLLSPLLPFRIRIRASCFTILKCDLEENATRSLGYQSPKSEILIG